MDQEKSRIQEDLKGRIRGDVLVDELTTQLYASDASIHSCRPLGVVRPANLDDVVECVKYAGEHDIPLHPRGAGTNFTGSAIGNGILLDFSVKMRRFNILDDAIEVQAGATLGSVNQLLKARQQTFGPDPIHRDVKTFAGVTSVNASGPRWLVHGSVADNLLGMRVVLADGSVLETDVDNSVRQRVMADLHKIGMRRSLLLNQAWPRLAANAAGYNLKPLADTLRYDDRTQSLSSDTELLNRMLCGSEGTLGVITDLKLRIKKQPPHRGVLMLFFGKLEDAVQSALEIVKTGVRACDLFDRRLLSIARDFESALAKLIPDQVEAMLFIEVEAESPKALSQLIDGLADRYIRRKKVATESRSTTQPDVRTWYWQIVRRAISRLYKLKGRRRALPFVDDCAVPIKELPRLLIEIQSIFSRHDVTASIYANVGQGVVRAYPLLDLSNPDHVALIDKLSADIFGRVLEIGGAIAAGHGCGSLRNSWLRQQYGKVYEAFNEVKNTFDPQRILNPGVIVDAPARVTTKQIRASAVAPSWLSAQQGPADADQKGDGKRNRKKNSDDKLTQLEWDAEEVMLAARNCNGCGLCRSSSPVERMCPIFRVAPSEEASPRAKANLMRGLFAGHVDQNQIKSEAFKALADLCVNCHQCRLECPANVDIPKLMMEAKAQHIAVNGLKTTQWLLSRLDFLYAVAGRFPALTNFAIRTPLLRWGLERILGIAQSRKLPAFANRTFVRWSIRQRLHLPVKSGEKKVLFFVDAFANWNDPELAQAAVKVLQHNGYQVFVPPDQLISGISMISSGLIDRAQKLVRRNVEVLAEYVRQGYHVIATEPSAALALQHEYQNVFLDKDVELVSGNTSDLSAFLWRLHQQGQLELDFRPLNCTVGYHLPCHQRALRDHVAGWRLLALIPGVKIEKIEQGCSGMAGTFGLQKNNFRRSLRAGLKLINAVRAPQLMAGSTECSTCKIQMEQGSTKPTIHPIKILAKSYGLMPELDDLFERRSQTLTTSP